MYKVLIDNLLLLLYTGLRDREARTLKWADIDFKKDTLTVRDTKKGSNFLAHISPPLKPYLRELETLTGNDNFIFSSIYTLETSVGRILPPPSVRMHLHWPQVPPPPQADGI